MLKIPQINLITSYSKKVQQKNFPCVSMSKNPKDNASLSTHPVSFGSGYGYVTSIKPDWMSDKQYEYLYDIIPDDRVKTPKNDDNYGLYFFYTPANIGSRKKIFKALTEKNVKYIEPIVDMNRGKLDEDTIIEMLKYIDETDESEEDINKKIDFMVNLEKNLTDENCLGKYLYDKNANGSDGKTFFDEIGNQTFPILLKRDILTTKDESSNFSVTAKKIANIISSNKDWSGKEIQNQNAVVAAQKFTAKYLGEIMFASTLMTDVGFNDFVYNSFKYIEDEKDRAKFGFIDTEIFDSLTGKLAILTQDDVNMMRYISKYAKEQTNEGENKLSSTTTIKIFQMIATARLLSNKGIGNFDEWLKKEFETQENEGIRSFFINDMHIERAVIQPILSSNRVDEETIEKYLEKYDEAVKKCGKASKIDETKFWDMNYIYLLANLHNDKDMEDIVQFATECTANADDIESLDMHKKALAYVSQKTSRETKSLFGNAGVDFEKWLNPSIPPETFRTTKNRNVAKKPKDIDKLTDKKHESEITQDIKEYTARIWNRIPQQSIFDGNYTTCCTGMGKPEEKSFFKFLSDGFSNTIEIRNERGEVKAMSRVYLGKVDGETSLIVDNIEINNTTTRKYIRPKQRNAVGFRNMILRYAQNLAKDIKVGPGKPLKVYTRIESPRSKMIFDNFPADYNRRDVEIFGVIKGCYINIIRGRYNGDSKIMRTKQITDITDFDFRENQDQ